MGVVFWDVIEEHLDEAEFFWQRWERRLDAPADTLDGVEEGFEERLFAHIDGLEAGGETVRAKVLVPALDEASGARRAAVAFTLAGSRDPGALAAVIAKLADDGAREDVVRALGLANVPDLRAALGPALDDAAPAVRGAAMRALAFRGEAPPPAHIRADDAPELVIAALQIASLSGDRTQAALARDALASDVPDVRDAALAAGLTLALPEAWSACRKLVEGASERTPAAALVRPLRWVAMGGAARDMESVLFAVRLGPQRPAALAALAASGRAAAAEACLPWIGDREAGPLAADAFVAITGMAVEKGILAPRDEADDTAPAPLPRLRAEAVLAWWTAHQGRFHRTRRYLLGRPATFETAASILATGPMRRRGPLAEEILLRSRGLSRVETRAFAARQRVEMARLRPPASTFEQPFG